MNELLREAISAAERALTGDYALVQDHVERLTNETGKLQSCGDEERAYLALLLDSISLHDESIRILQDTSEPIPADANAALQNVEGMLAAVRNQHEETRRILRNALSAAGSPSLRNKILANLAAVSLRAASVNEAEAWAEAADADKEAQDLAVAVLIASVRAGTASARGDLPGLRSAAAALRKASTSRIVELGTQHPQALAIVATLASTEIPLARAEGFPVRLERAIDVLKVAAIRLAAELGSDHPLSLAAMDSLASARPDRTHARGSVQKMRPTDTAEPGSRRADPGSRRADPAPRRTDPATALAAQPSAGQLDVLRHSLGTPVMPASLERALTHRSYAYENAPPADPGRVRRALQRAPAPPVARTTTSAAPARSAD